MKLKPIEVQVNLPVYFEFETEDELAQMAANINSILAGRKRVKYEIVGDRGDKLVGLLYLERNRDYGELRDFVLQYIVDPDKMPEPEPEEP